MLTAFKKVQCTVCTYMCTCIVCTITTVHVFEYANSRGFLNVLGGFQLQSGGGTGGP